MKNWSNEDRAAAALAKRQAAQPGVDAFADLISEGYSLSSAARLLDKSQAWSAKALAKLRADLGWQAQ